MSRELNLGRVVHVLPSGALLVQAPGELPVAHGGRGGPVRMGATAVDARHERVGRIADVLGPVARPYLLVQPDRGAKLHRMAGKDVYLSTGAPSGPRPDARRDAPPPPREGPSHAQKPRPPFRPDRSAPAKGGTGDPPARGGPGWKPRRGGHR